MAVVETPNNVILSAPAPNPTKSCGTETVGRPGLRTYYYWVIANYPIGSSVSTPFLIRNAPNSLNSTNHVAISWEAVPNVTNYDLLRTDTSEFPVEAGNYAVATGITVTFWRDQGTSLGHYDTGGLKYGAPVRCLITLNNRDYPQPTLEMPCQLSVMTLIFSDGSTQWTAGGGGGSSPILYPGSGINFVSVPGPPPSITINSDVYSWKGNVNGGGHNLTNVANVDVTNSFSINGVPFAVAGSINLTNIKNISGETGQPVTITSNAIVTGNINLTGTAPVPQFLINGAPLNLGGTPAGAADQIQYNAGGTPPVFGASANLVWDNSQSRLGVGPNAIDDANVPTGALQVVTTINRYKLVISGPGGSVIFLRNEFVPTQPWSIHIQNNGQFQIQDAGVPWLSISTNGRVGIDESDPDYKLHVNGDCNLSTGSVYRINGVPLAFTADQINLNPAVSTWTTVQNAISGINTTLLTLARGMAYVGTYDAAGDIATFVASVGIAPGPLPAPNATGLHPGDFVICTSATTTGPHAPLNVGDQLVTDGTAWSRVAVGFALASITAATVPLSPVVGGWSTVQDAMTALNTLNTNAVLTTGSYADPTWITSLAWSKITNVPAGISGPAGAVGQIQFNAGGTPNVFGASANLFWNSANGRLGVHESAPAYDVDIDGDLNVTGDIYIDGVVFASPGSAHLHATSIGGLDGQPLQIMGDVHFEGTTLQRLLDRLDLVEQKLGSL